MSKYNFAHKVPQQNIDYWKPVECCLLRESLFCMLPHTSITIMAQFSKWHFATMYICPCGLWFWVCSKYIMHYVPKILGKNTMHNINFHMLNWMDTQADEFTKFMKSVLNCVCSFLLVWRYRNLKNSTYIGSNYKVAVIQPTYLLTRYHLRIF